MAQKQFTLVTLEKLQTYQSLITKYVDDADAKSLKSVAISGNTLKFYKEVAPTAETVASFSIDLPETDISNLLEKFAGATAGDVVTVAADGKNIVDSGVKVTDLATNAKVKEISDLVGTIPEGYKSTNIADFAKELADAVAANGYDDTALTTRVATVEGKVDTLQGADTVEGSVAKQIKDAKTELETKITESAYDDTVLKAKVTANEEAIATLNGDKTQIGSVAKQVADAVAAIVSDAPEAYDTLKEISDWISSHASDASAMNTQITTNKTDIANLKKLIGDLPEGADSTTIVAYIAEAIGASKTELTTAIATAKSEAIAEAKTYSDGKDAAIAAAKKAGDDAQTDVDALETKVGMVTEGKTVVQMIAEAQSAATYDDTALVARVTELESTTFVEATDAQIKALFTTN